MQRRTFLMLSGSVALLGSAPRAENQKLSLFQSYPLPESPPKPTYGNRFSQIAQSRGVQVYSMGADHVSAVAFSGQLEWVGGPLGIKQVDRIAKRVRVYSTDDGLPMGEVLQIVAEGKEAYALAMRPSDGLISFCALEPSTDRWRVLTERAAEPGNYPPNQKGSLALSTDWVAFAPEHTRLLFESSAPYYFFHRRTRKLQLGKFDPVIAADHGHLEISAALIQGSTFWLGTSIGVLGVPLSATAEPTRWQRFLPDRHVQRLVALSAGTVAALSIDRRNESKQALHSLALATGKAMPLPQPFAFFPNRPKTLLGEDGTLWYLAEIDPRSDRGNLGKPLVMRLKPKAAQWETIPAVQMQAGARPASGFSFLEPVMVATRATIPDLVAATLVCLLERGFSPNFGQPARMLQLPWLEQRFWRWRSPETKLPSSVASNVHAYGSAELADPSNPETIWLTERDEFVSVPRAERSKWEAIPGSYVNGEPLRRRLPLTSPHVQRFSLDFSRAREGFRVQTLVSGQVALALSDGNRTRAALLLRQDGTLEALPFTSKRNPETPPILSGGVAAGKDQHCFLHYTFEPTLWRWDTAAKQLIDTGITPSLEGYRVRGGTTEGLWWPTNTQGKLLLQRLTTEGTAAGKPEVVIPDFAPIWKGNTPDLVAIAGNKLWFQGYTPQGGSPLLAVWSPAKKTWSPATVSSYASNGELAVTESEDGTCWVAVSGTSTALRRYDPQANRWEQVPPPQSEKEGLLSPCLLSADEARVWVATLSGLWCYQHETRVWERGGSVMPHALCTGGFSGLISVGKGQWWVGTHYGLWRFDASTGAFSEATVPAGTGSLPLHLKAVTETAVWGLKGSLLARLDRQKGTAVLYGRESGVPESLSARFCEAGGTAWLLDQGAQLYPFRGASPYVPFPSPPAEGNGRQTSWIAVATDPSDSHRVILAAQRLYRATPEQLDPTPLPQPPGEREIRDLLTLGSWVYVAASDGLWRFNTAQKWERLSAYVFGELRRDTEQPQRLWALSGQGPGAFSALLACIDPRELAGR